MQAIKCDRCGKCEKSLNWYQMNDPELLRSPVVREMHYPKRVDLCDACGEELRHILRDWFAAVPHGKG